eukprot:186616-Rhodomonas_salina.1
MTRMPRDYSQGHGKNSDSGASKLMMIQQAHNDTRNSSVNTGMPIRRRRPLTLLERATGFESRRWAPVAGGPPHTRSAPRALQTRPPPASPAALQSRPEP